MKLILNFTLARKALVLRDLDQWTSVTQKREKEI